MVTIRFCLDFGDYTLGNSIIVTEKSNFLYLFRSRGILSYKYIMKVWLSSALYTRLPALCNTAVISVL